MQLLKETPPHMWGRLLVRISATTFVGNTPTHVGKTQRHFQPLHLARKHPHTCGEDPRAAPLLVLRVETPPHMWGRQYV